MSQVCTDAYFVTDLVLNFYVGYFHEKTGTLVVDRVRLSHYFTQRHDLGLTRLQSACTSDTEANTA